MTEHTYTDETESETESNGTETETTDAAAVAADRADHTVQSEVQVVVPVPTWTRIYDRTRRGIERGKDPELAWRDAVDEYVVAVPVPVVEGIGPRRLEDVDPVEQTYTADTYPDERDESEESDELLEENVSAQLDIDEETYQRLHDAYLEELDDGYGAGFETFVVNHCATDLTLTVDGEPVDPDGE